MREQAEGEASAVEIKAAAQARAISLIANALNDTNSGEAARLHVAREVGTVQPVVQCLIYTISTFAMIRITYVYYNSTLFMFLQRFFIKNKLLKCDV